MFVLARRKEDLHPFNNDNSNNWNNTFVHRKIVCSILFYVLPSILENFLECSKMIVRPRGVTEEGKTSFLLYMPVKFPLA